jgi:hypothetical protein
VKERVGVVIFALFCARFSERSVGHGCKRFCSLIDRVLPFASTSLQLRRAPRRSGRSRGGSGARTRTLHRARADAATERVMKEINGYVDRDDREDRR